MAERRVPKIVFFGNCQCGVLASLYQRVAPSEPGCEVLHVPNYQKANERHRQVVANADILVQQVMDSAPKSSVFATRAAIHFIPHITCAFLWPLMGEPHPRNAPIPYGDIHGPYAGEIGDALLNRMILDEVDPDDAVPRYLATDVAALRRVERLRDSVLERQRTRDKACGFNFADLIDSRFRTERLFKSGNHPGRMLTLMLATEVFSRMGLDNASLAYMQTISGRDLFPPTEAPIHPSIAAHFGISYVNSETRYTYFAEGSFTIAEFAGRYMRYEHCTDFPLGLHLHRTGQLEEAAAVLRRAREAMPRSAPARSALSDVLDKLGRADEAMALAEEAVALQPDVDHLQQRLAELRRRLARTTQQRLAS